MLNSELQGAEKNAKDYDADLHYGFSRYIGPEETEIYNAYRAAANSELAIEAYDERDDTDIIHWSIPFFNRAIVEIEIQYEIKQEIRFCITKSKFDSGETRINSTPTAMTHKGNYYILIPSELIYKQSSILMNLDFNLNEIQNEDLSMEKRGQSPNESIFAFALCNMLEEKEYRTNVVVAYAQLSFSFWVYHEMAHIKNGHLHLLKKMNYDAETQRAVLRTLEFDADCMSVSWLFHRIRRAIGQEFSTLHAPLPIDPFIVRDEMDAAKNAAAIIVICFFCHLKPSSSADIWTGSHAPLFCRMELAFRTIITILRRYDNYQNLEPEEVREEILPYVSNIIRKLKSIYPREFSNQDFSFKKYIDAYQHELSLVWNGIRSSLEPNLLGGTLAPIHNVEIDQSSKLASQLVKARALEGWPTHKWSTS